MLYCVSSGGEEVTILEKPRIIRKNISNNKILSLFLMVQLKIVWGHNNMISQAHILQLQNYL